MSFSSFGFSDLLLQAINGSGYVTPTPVQLRVIPAVLAGRDVMAAAQTGTGKTACFALPLLQRLGDRPKLKSNHVRVLILTPTRELAMQVEQSIADYGKYLPLKSAVVYGGVKLNPQMMKLRGGVDLLVATPGRLLDLFSQNAVKFAQVETLVLDEADRMLDMGFIGDIRRIIALLPGKRQNLLFSATFSDEIRKLSRGLLNKPLEIDISPRNSTAKNLKQCVYEVDKGKKSALLSHLVRNKGWEQVLVFVRTRNGADNLVKKLVNDGVAAATIHGDKSQGERARALAEFKENRTRVLVATDVAARGIDINELPHVINFDLPKVAEDYIHRIGRTGRAGCEGEGISLVSADEVKLLSAIEGLIRQTLVREVETGFIPKHKVPLTRQMKIRPKKPKKGKTSAKSGEGRKTKSEQENADNKPRRGRKVQDAEQFGGRGRRGQQTRDGSAPPTRKRTTEKPKSGRRTPK
ncbi:MAG TPA: DEAD/DEAH box helicase [Geopsychrobacteraceae bacterium]|nr:DEAD/DEAH box helicase [Geopsychrobacteraceae bacterium]